mmetsp:Transcript_21527/g.50145  ORF Transcript_21527/g.50145 Transcript_21527/m.50145 type:complete len:201 (-) Transcript_21527:2440-3042(-)
MRECRCEGAVNRQGYGEIAHDPVKEPVDVVTFVGFWAVNVLWPERRPTEAHGRGTSLDAELLVVLLHVAHLDEGLVLPRLVHATGAHIGIGLGSPWGHSSLYVQRAHILIIEHILTWWKPLKGTCKATLCKVCPSDLNPSSLQVSVTVKGRGISLGGTVGDDGDINAPGKLQGQVVADLAVPATLVLNNEGCGLSACKRC